MAQVLLITTETEVKDFDDIGDIVGVYDDDHQFSEREKEAYEIRSVKGSAERVQAKLRSLRPVEAFAYKIRASGKWTLTLPDPDQTEEFKAVWQNPTDSKWYFLEKQIKYKATFKELTSTDLDDLKNDDIDTIAKGTTDKMKKDPGSLFSENNTEVPDVN